MNLANVKKTFNKANQLLSEKIGNAKGTELDTEYIKNEKSIDSYKELFEDLLNKVMEYLQPNPTHRAKLMTLNAFHKFQNKTGQKAMYPQIEGQLSEIFEKYASESDNSVFGKSLKDCSETFRDLEECKNSLEDSMKQNFIDPVLNLKSQELKEISAHRKKVHSRRLHYDGLKRNKDKVQSNGSKVNEVELEDARKKFEESKDLTTVAMSNFIDSEADHINLIAEFIKAERDFHQQAAETLESLHKKFLKRRDEVNSDSYSPHAKSSHTKSSWGSGQDGDAASPGSGSSSVFVMKKGYADSGKSIPTCRALYEFHAENAEELSFQEGDTIKLIQQVDENWFEGELHGNVGFFPINFVEVLVPLRD